MLSNALLTLALSAFPGLPDDPDRVEAWTEDLVVLVEQAESLHPDLFFAVPQEEFYAAVDALFERIPELTDDQVIVEMMRLVAMIAREGRDGSSRLSAWRQFTNLPVQVYRFSDGWFVTESEADETLVGARLEAIGGMPIDEVCERVASILTRDNQMDLIGRLATPLIQPELLHAVGVTPERERATLRLVKRDGSVGEVTLEGRRLERGRFGNYPFWGPGLPRDPDVRWLAKHEGSWHFEIIEEAKAMYVRYDAVFAQERDTGRTLVEFTDTFMGAAHAAGVERIVVDVRSNGGGDKRMFTPLVERLRASPWNEPGRLFVLTGRKTTSAAGHFVTVVQKETEARLIGEPPGAPPGWSGLWSTCVPTEAATIGCSPR